MEVSCKELAIGSNMERKAPVMISVSLDICDCSDGSTTNIGATCLNSHGHVVEDGEHFTPLGSDPCAQCTCVDGKRERCRSLLCSPIKKCEHQKPSPDKCCEFVCIELPGNNGTITINKGGGQFGSTDSNLRLVASTFTSVLILALLMFMIYRLRKRRLMVVLRRVNNEILNNSNNNSSQRYSVDGDIGIGYYVGRDQIDFYGYDDPPPPYTLWKPPNVYIPPGEAPPPYEASLATAIPSYNSLPESNEHSIQLELPRYSLPVFHTTNQTVTQPAVRNENFTNVSALSATQENTNSCGAINADVRYEEQPYFNFSTDIPNHRENLDCSNVQNKPTKYYSTSGDYRSSWIQRESRNFKSDRHCAIGDWGIEDTSSSSPSSSSNSTISLSSSESSSIVEFSFNSYDVNNRDSSLSSRSTTLPKCLYHPHRQHRYSSTDRTINFDRTLQHLKKLSLIRKKQKSKSQDASSSSQINAPAEDPSILNNVMTQSQCSTMSNPETSSWALENQGASAAASESEESRASQNLQNIRKFRRGNSLHSAGSSINSHYNSFPTPGVRKKFNPAIEEHLSIESSVSEMPKENVVELSRSGSVCSETGERKNRKNDVNDSNSVNVHQKRSSRGIDNKYLSETLYKISPYNSLQGNTKENLTCEVGIKSKSSDSAHSECGANFHYLGSTPILLHSRKHLNDHVDDLENADEVIAEKNLQSDSLNPHELKNDSDENVWVPLPQQSNDKRDSESLSWESSQESKL
ncbi:Integral membrane protein DGCR2/IDD [Nymphon striatum]|nr:Integral membrane protein DGCR2/IDD [Nymphon striatum]